MIRHPFQNLSPRTKLAGVLFANAAILLLWTWLFRPVYPYLRILFTRQEFRTNQIVLVVILVLIVIQLRREKIHFPLLNLPQLYLPGLILAICGAVAFLAAERWLEINTLSATLFALASYGLLGLWLEPRQWFAGLPAALLLVGILPFGEHMDTFIGYPLRLATARMVSQGLAALGVPNLGVDTILVFEKGLSQVDNPCSGVKSLWTGGLFFLATTWIEHRPVNKRWILAALLFTGMLLAANLARVGLLVLAGPVARLDLLAEMLHVPLGIIGFLVACFGALSLLRWCGKAPSSPMTGQPVSPPRPRWLAFGLTAVLVGLILVYVPAPQPVTATSLAWEFPEDLQVKEWPLTPMETNWLSNGGANRVNGSRWRFQWQGTSGSLLFITSDSWQSHHRPERCFTVYGLEVQEARLWLADADFPLRWLTLGSPQTSQTLYTAGYWLQSSDQVTDDYAVRIWDDLSPQPKIWVLVTILFDKPADPAGAEIEALFSVLHRTVQTILNENGS
jgi:exosortase O